MFMLYTTSSIIPTLVHCNTSTKLPANKLSFQFFIFIVSLSSSFTEIALEILSPYYPKPFYSRLVWPQHTTSITHIPLPALSFIPNAFICHRTEDWKEGRKMVDVQGGTDIHARAATCKNITAQRLFALPQLSITSLYTASLLKIYYLLLQRILHDLHETSIRLKSMSQKRLQYLVLWVVIIGRHHQKRENLRNYELSSNIYKQQQALHGSQKPRCMNRPLTLETTSYVWCGRPGKRR